MMRIKEKLNSNAGASMMLALALLLVCVVVSSIILTAATSGASRNLRRTQQQREYLAVSSAAELLQKNLKDVGKIGGTTEINVHACQELEQQGFETVDIIDSDEVTEGTYIGYLLSNDPTGTYMNKMLVMEGPDGLKGELCTSSNVLHLTTNEFYGPYAELMSRAAVHVFEKKMDYTETFFITVKDENERLPEVRCDFTMNQAYTVKIDIYVNGGVSDYSMTLELPAIKTETDNGDTNEVTCSHMVLSIEEVEGGIVNPKLQMEELILKNDCPTILLEWKGTPKLSKGGQ